jgi:hypothetical protein
VLTPPPEEQPANAPVLSTLRVAPTGNLQLVDRRAIENARVIAAEPRGRVLFVGGGRKPTSWGRHVTTYPGYLRTYAIDPAAGTVTALSERELPHSDSPRMYLQAERVVANETTVYVIATSAYSWQKVLDYGFDAPTGALTDAPGFNCESWWHPAWVLPSKPNLLAADGGLDCYPDWQDYRPSAFGVFAPDPTDGRLVRIARATPPSPGASGPPAAAQVGNCVAVSWEGQLAGRRRSPSMIDPPRVLSARRPAPPTAIAASSNSLVAATTTTTATLLTLH